MAERNSIYRMAMKAMGIFGGVQMIGIICSIVRTKLVAMWIGPVGMGLFGLGEIVRNLEHVADMSRT